MGLVWLALSLGLVAGCRPSDSDVVRRRGAEGSADEQEQIDAPPTEDPRGVVAFLGTSLTAGLGLDDPALAFPGRIQERIEQANLPYRVVNAGVSGDTSAGGLRRLDWLLDEPVAVLVVELGANDGLRGLDIEELRSNLIEIVDRTRERRPGADIVLVGMEAPPNLGSRYTDQFRQVFVGVSTSLDLPLVPFLLEGVGGVPELNQDDQIHPNPRGHDRLADNLWPVLEPVLRARAGADPEGAHP